MLDASSLTLVVVSAPASCASLPHQSDIEQSALASLGLVFKREVRLLDRPADVFSVAASDSNLNDLLRDGLKDSNLNDLLRDGLKDSNFK